MTEPNVETGRPIVTGLRGWEKIADELPFTQLERSRSAADKWLTTISALTGLTGLLTLLSGQANLASLNPYGEWSVGALLALAFVSALTAIFQGAMAAQGKPTSLLNDPVQVREWYRSETLNVTKALRLSRRASLLAAVLVGCAFFTTWYGPKDRATKLRSNALITLNSGKTVCDRLSLARDRIIISLGDVEDMSATNLKSVKIVNTCP